MIVGALVFGGGGGGVVWCAFSWRGRWLVIVGRALWLGAVFCDVLLAGDFWTWGDWALFIVGAFSGGCGVGAFWLAIGAGLFGWW